MIKSSRRRRGVPLRPPCPLAEWLRKGVRPIDAIAAAAVLLEWRDAKVRAAGKEVDSGTQAHR